MAPRSIELLAPTGICGAEGRRPRFAWRTDAAPRRGAPIKQIEPPDRAEWHVEVWPIESGEDPGRVVRRKPLLSQVEDARRTSAPYPKNRPSLDVGVGYVWRVSLFTRATRSRKAALLERSELGIFYMPDPSIPVPIEQLRCCDDRRIGDRIDDWATAYGDPQFKPKTKGCLGAVGAVELAGTATSGDAVTQFLDPSLKIEGGKHYMVSVCVRALTRDLDYVRLRVVAHNGSLPTSGDHPDVSANVAPIGTTGRITSKDWTWVILPPWCAPRDFGRISIAAVGDSDDATTGDAVGQFSNVCVREVDGCDTPFGPFGPGGSLALPKGMLRTNPEPTAQLVATDLGAMVDLYGGPFDDDGSSNWYAEGNDCSSFGGWIPDDLDAEVPWEGEDPPLTADEIHELVQKVIDDLKHPALTDLLEPIELKPESCDDWDPAPFPHEPRHSNKDGPPVPFSGRDIVYVHGFVPSHVLARLIAEDPTIRAIHTSLGLSLASNAQIDNIRDEWPDVPAAYLAGSDPADDGFFRQGGNSYWSEHIVTYLTGPGQPNRYMVAGYNCSQRLVFAVHTVLTQIADAMNTGAGVRNPDAEDPTTDCFGTEFVVVTHSTGALVTNVAMAVAEQTAVPGPLQDAFGDVSLIAKRATVHLSLHGAISGSDAAQLAVAGAAVVGGLGVVADAVTDSLIAGGRLVARGMARSDGEAARFDAFFNALAATDAAIAAMVATVPEVVFASILVDLSPIVSKVVWGPFTAVSPTPTLTVAGGHPSFGGMEGAPYVLKPVLAGLDDGVVNTNSQGGSFNPFHPDRYTPIPGPERVFDMGLPLIRSVPYFVEQTFWPLGVAYGVSPWLSPSGMVQPVLLALPTLRFPNQFAFLQAASDHAYTTDIDDEHYVPTFGADNYEESFVIDDPAVLTSGLVNPAIVGHVRRFERRLDLTMCIRFPVPNITLFPPSFTVTMVEVCVTFTVWRRLYDLLAAGAGQGTSVTVSTPVASGPLGITGIASATSTDPISSALTSDDTLSETSYAYRFVLPA
ncbi:MAG: hypothetical protein QNJ12_05515 [Ilumatobacter sp.]|uniref:hypothetical protein n=1 Tax=Ilumatobacter sp. TaxID=1967498 RepID=UPI00262FEFE9|nr:hypothetical protein [Ilumatobacter sp.]MDJ0768228.1 hypothetical protein [Ilumatobacter sp.]